MFDKQQPAVNIMRVFCKLRVSRYDTVRVDGHGGGEVVGEEERLLKTKEDL